MSWLFPTKAERLRRIAKLVHKEKSPKVRKHLLKGIKAK
jgi:hypothetical protein